MTRAFGMGSALLTAALQYSTIIFAALLGMGFWGDHLDGVAWAGMGLIISAGLLSTRSTPNDDDTDFRRRSGRAPLYARRARVRCAP
ncbi:hypothetical protein G6F24_018378 [Rhizopus arrhizus]|nr:hypothetical protein G6F24_018378 [Rhizopus arrhizus]